jgi:hypothetical protein
MTDNLPSNPYAGEIAAAPRLQDRKGYPFAARRQVDQPDAELERLKTENAELRAAIARTVDEVRAALMQVPADA